MAHITREMSLHLPLDRSLIGVKVDMLNGVTVWLTKTSVLTASYDGKETEIVVALKEVGRYTTAHLADGIKLDIYIGAKNLLIDMRNTINPHTEDTTNVDQLNTRQS